MFSSITDMFWQHSISSTVQYSKVICFACSIYHQQTVILDPVVQSPISTNPGLTLNKTCRVNPGLALIGSGFEQLYGGLGVP